MADGTEVPDSLAMVVLALMSLIAVSQDTRDSVLRVPVLEDFEKYMISIDTENDDTLVLKIQEKL